MLAIIPLPSPPYRLPQVQGAEEAQKERQRQKDLESNYRRVWGSPGGEGTGDLDEFDFWDRHRQLAKESRVFLDWPCLCPPQPLGPWRRNSRAELRAVDPEAPWGVEGLWGECCC